MTQMIKESENHLQTNSQLQNLTKLAQLSSSDRQKPNLLRIRADNQQKKFMCVFWSIFLVFVVTLAIVSKALPKAIKPITNETQLDGTNIQKCQNPNVSSGGTIMCGNFSHFSPIVGIVVRQLSPLNQFVSFWLEIYPKDMGGGLVFEQNLTYLIYGLETVANGFRAGELYENETVAFSLNSQSAKYVYGDDRSVKGYRTFIGFIGQFPTRDLILTLQLNGPSQQLANITLSLKAYKIRKSFTFFTIVLRYVFFVLSLLAAFLYNRNYRKISVNDRIIEQKLIEILSLVVIFFNDPFYPITVLKENMFRYAFLLQKSSFFSMLFVLTFVVYLVFVWIVFFDRILYEEGQKDTHQITKFKIAYCAVLLALLMTLYMLYANYRINEHPLIPSQTLTEPRILALDIVTSIFFGASILYIVTQYIRICCYKPERLWRSQLMMSYSLLFIVAMMLFFFTDNALGSYNYEGTSFIFLYGLMNLYVWYLQFMYSRAGEEAEKNRMIGGEEMMSVGTMDFNDLNINLDENEEWKGGKGDGLLYEKANGKRIHTGWGGQATNNGNSEEDEYHKEKHFSIQKGNSRPPKIYNQSNLKQQNTPIQQINFFNQQAINQLASSQSHVTQTTNLLQLSANQQQKNPSFFLEPSSQVDQNQFEIISETVSQSPEDNNATENCVGNYVANTTHKDKKEQSFGEFQME